MAKKKLEPLVSLIITTKNEERNIENCLKSFKLQSYKKIEIIVVDNGSEDKTKELAKKYTDKVYDKGPERSAQRNYGMIEKARGEYVMFVDCDMILSPNLVKESVEAMEHNDYVALHLPEIVLGDKYWSRVRRFERTFYDGTVIDGARFFKKSVFKKVGGFDSNMSGPEDWDIDKKMKQEGKIHLLQKPEIIGHWPMRKFILERGINPNRYGVVVYHNEAEFDVKKYLEKKGYYATSFDSYIEKWGKDDPDIKKQLGLSYRFFGVFFENGKWLKLFAHPFLTFGMIYLRFMVGLKFVFRKKKGAVENPYKKNEKKN